MKNVMQYMVREDWLLAAIEEMRPKFDKVGYPLPQVIHVSTGFALAGAVENTKILGCTLSSHANDDGNLSVFVSPFVKDTIQALLTLLHELIHVTLDNADGHRGRFREVAYAFGFQPSLLTLNPSWELDFEMAQLAEKLGAFPNPGMDKLKELILNRGPRPGDGTVNPQSETDKRRFWSAPKQQTARQVKCWCARKSCGYTVRTTRKWLDVAVPRCPVHDTKMKVEVKT